MSRRRPDPRGALDMGALAAAVLRTLAYRNISMERAAFELDLSAGHRLPPRPPRPLAARRRGLHPRPHLARRGPDHPIQPASQRRRAMTAKPFGDWWILAQSPPWKPYPCMCVLGRTCGKWCSCRGRTDHLDKMPAPLLRTEGSRRRRKGGSMTCDVCGLPDLHNGDGDGIGSCECPRCDCGAAAHSQFCTCPPDDIDQYWPEE